MDEKPRNILRLASANPRPRRPSCTACLHYHPAMQYGHIRIVRSWWPPFFRIVRAASADSFQYAACSYYGGHYATIARNTCEGDNWEAADE